MPLPPDPDAIRSKRDSAGLTQADAAKLVHANDRLWRYWESGTHRMPPGLWELFCLKVHQLLEART